MVTKQGSLDLLKDPIAQDLLRSVLLTHLAYNWSDGTPRVVPIGFYWNGTDIVICSSVDAPKARVLKTGAKVALTIADLPAAAHVLMIRGTVRVDVVDGLAAEWIKAVEKSGKEQARGILENSAKLYRQMARFFIRPEWVGLLDFETRLPSAVEKGLARLQE